MGGGSLQTLALGRLPWLPSVAVQWLLYVSREGIPLASFCLLSVNSACSGAVSVLLLCSWSRSSSSLYRSFSSSCNRRTRIADSSIPARASRHRRSTSSPDSSSSRILASCHRCSTSVSWLSRRSFLASHLFCCAAKALNCCNSAFCCWFASWRSSSSATCAFSSQALTVSVSLASVASRFLRVARLLANCCSASAYTQALSELTAANCSWALCSSSCNLRISARCRNVSSSASSSCFLKSSRSVSRSAMRFALPGLVTAPSCRIWSSRRRFSSCSISICCFSWLCLVAIPDKPPCVASWFLCAAFCIGFP